MFYISIFLFFLLLHMVGVVVTAPKLPASVASETLASLRGWSLPTSDLLQLPANFLPVLLHPGSSQHGTSFWTNVSTTLTPIFNIILKADLKPDLFSP